MATFSLQLLIMANLAAYPGPAAQGAPDWQPRVQALIRQLGDASFAKREAATKELLAEGDKIVPLLDQARKTADLELARRIDRIRQQVGFADELMEFLRGPTFADAPKSREARIAMVLNPEPDPLPGIIALVAKHQPRAGDFLLKIIADHDHPLRRPATRLFCVSCSSGSPEQVRE